MLTFRKNYIKYFVSCFCSGRTDSVSIKLVAGPKSVLGKPEGWTERENTVNITWVPGHTRWRCTNGASTREHGV
ncbi:unnamed protein product [Ceratitis capitata]|uniref:(Mediterranean fruit fly) hypothetical protein n=1 Tax=Ceratitis capitata TaxID=7213 RepID=A0A811U1Z6_CERCA|nr:unnamed protein product [Ceratitis capitata]